MLFGDLIIWYLFLGGIGSGAYLVWFAAAILAKHLNRTWFPFMKDITGPMLIVTLVILAMGGLCLLKDAAKPDRLLLVFTQPTVSALSIGAFALGLLIIGILFLIIAHYRDGFVWKNVLFFLVGTLSAILSIVTVVYTGVFLSNMDSVPFWTSPLLPILFTLSSLSTGIAVMLIVAVTQKPLGKLVATFLKTLMKADFVIIVLEALTVYAMYLELNADPVSSLSVADLMDGSLSTAFWLGFITCALVMPLAMEAFSILARNASIAYYVSLGCFILVGGFFLRFCVISAGIHLSSMMFVGT